MSPWFAFAAFAALALSSLGHPVTESEGPCTSLNQRKSWNDLSNAERAEYIRAERCLMNHPPLVGTIEGAKNVWDELHYLHISQGNYVHYVGYFLPWHRYLVRTHELLLQTNCGYKGAHPYWDELTDYEAAPLEESSIFDPVFGFGGNGVGDEGCIDDGPFSDLTLHMKRHSNHASYCLSRVFDESCFIWANRSNIEECYAEQDYDDAWACYNMYPHSAGHCAVGGLMFDPVESNGDPIFYLHHAYLDRLWWRWQQADLLHRLYDVVGANVPPQDVLDQVALAAPSRSLVNYSGDDGNITTLDHILYLHGLAPNITVAEVMDLEGDVICAEYID